MKILDAIFAAGLVVMFKNDLNSLLVTLGVLCMITFLRAVVLISRGVELLEDIKLLNQIIKLDEETGGR